MRVLTGVRIQETRGFMASNRNKVALLAFAFLFIRFAVSAGSEIETMVPWCCDHVLCIGNGVEQQELVTEALRELHKLLDDDESGGIDSIESKDVCEIVLEWWMSNASSSPAC